MNIINNLKKIANILETMKLYSYAVDVDKVIKSAQDEMQPGSDEAKELEQKDQQIIERMLQILGLPAGYTNINRIREEYRRKHFDLWRIIRSFLVSQKNAAGSGMPIEEYKKVYDSTQVRVNQLRKELRDLHDSMAVLEEKLAPTTGVVSPEEKAALKEEVKKNEEEFADLDNELYKAEQEYNRKIDMESSEEEKQKYLDKINELKSRIKKRTEEGILFDGTLDIMELSRLKYKIDLMNRRAAKLNLEPMQIVYTMSDEEKDHLGRPMYFAKVRGRMPQLEGWKLIGVIDHMSTGNALRSIDGEDISSRYMNALSSTCDECDVKHSRNQTMILQNTSGETKIIGKRKPKHIQQGETIQVGSACLSDFINKASIAMWLEWAKMEKELVEGRGDPGVEISLFIAMAAEEILHGGFKSAKMLEQSTVSKANGRYMDFVSPPTSMSRQEVEALKPSEKAIRLANDTIEWAKNLEPTNNYLRTIKTILSEPFLKSKDFYRYMGFAASAVDAYMRSKGKQEAVGGGEKGEFKATLLYGGTSRDGTPSYTFKDGGGNLIIVEGKLDESKLRKGNTYKILGTVTRSGISRNGNPYKIVSNAEVGKLSEADKATDEKPGTPYVGEVKTNGTFDLVFADRRESETSFGTKTSYIFKERGTNKTVFVNEGDYLSKWLQESDSEGNYNDFDRGAAYRITAYVAKQQNNYTVMNRVKNIQKVQ